MHGRALRQGALVLALFFEVAHAEAEEPNASLGGCSPARSAPGAERHDGFFLRGETGVALLSAHVGASPRGRSAVTGVGQSGGISLGATPWRGLVLGGQLWTARVDPSFVERGARITPDDDSVKLTLGALGPFLDWYPDPSAGYHVQLGVAALIAIESDTKGEPLRPASGGVKLGVASGYEWFVSRDLSLGFIVRVGMLFAARPRPQGPERMLAEVPELLLTSTYH